MVGHWLNLAHTGGSDDCTYDDFVEDTPPESNLIDGCPDFPAIDSCSPEFPGIMFMNFMDNRDDACMNLFTEGQKLRMRDLFSEGGLRYSLTYSPGCVGVTGIEEKDISNIYCFPNPAFNVLFVEFNSDQLLEVQLTIYDINGRKIRIQDEMVNTGYNLLQLEMEELTSGLYVVVLESGDQITSITFEKY